MHIQLRQLCSKININAVHTELTLLKFLPLTGDNVSPNLSARLRITSELAAYKQRVISSNLTTHYVLISSRKCTMLQFGTGNYHKLLSFKRHIDPQEGKRRTDCDMITITICKYTHEGLFGTSQHTKGTGNGIPYLSEYKKTHLHENPYIYISQLLCHFVLLA
jgi:hypothetical protein